MRTGRRRKLAVLMSASPMPMAARAVMSALNAPGVFFLGFGSGFRLRFHRDDDRGRVGHDRGGSFTGDVNLRQALSFIVIGLRLPGKTPPPNSMRTKTRAPASQAVEIRKRRDVGIRRLIMDDALPRTMGCFRWDVAVGPTWRYAITFEAGAGYWQRKESGAV